MTPAERDAELRERKAFTDRLKRQGPDPLLRALLMSRQRPPVEMAGKLGRPVWVR